MVPAALVVQVLAVAARRQAAPVPRPVVPVVQAAPARQPAALAVRVVPVALRPLLAETSQAVVVAAAAMRLALAALAVRVAMVLRPSRRVPALRPAATAVRAATRQAPVQGAVRVARAVERRAPRALLSAETAALVATVLSRLVVPVKAVWPFLPMATPLVVLVARAVRRLQAVALAVLVARAPPAEPVRAGAEPVVRAAAELLTAATAATAVAVARAETASRALLSAVTAVRAARALRRAQSAARAAMQAPVSRPARLSDQSEATVVPVATGTQAAVQVVWAGEAPYWLRARAVWAA